LFGQLNVALRLPGKLEGDIVSTSPLRGRLSLPHSGVLFTAT
jgi:hypothetical protein